MMALMCTVELTDIRDGCIRLVNFFSREELWRSPFNGSCLFVGGVLFQFWSLGPQDSEGFSEDASPHYKGYVDRDTSYLQAVFGWISWSKLSMSN